MSYVKHPSKFYKGTQQNKACARGAGGCMRVAVRSEGCGRGRPAGKPGIVPALGTPDAVSCHEKMPPPFAENLQAIHSIMNTQKAQVFWCKNACRPTKGRQAFCVHRRQSRHPTKALSSAEAPSRSAFPRFGQCTTTARLPICLKHCRNAAASTLRLPCSGSAMVQVSPSHPASTTQCRLA